MTKMKLSDLKVGDRFTVEAEIVDIGHNYGTLLGFKLLGATNNNNLYLDQIGKIEVTKLPDPPRDLVKGERIRPIASLREGEYLGRKYVWWNCDPMPVQIGYPATTEFYDVISE